MIKLTMESMSDKNRKIIWTLGLILVGLLLYLLLRDSSQTITGAKLEKLIAQNHIKKVVKKSDYLYLRGENDIYKIAVDGVDLKNLAKRYPIEVERERGLRELFIFLALGVFSGFLIWLIYALNEESKEITRNSSSNMFPKNNIRPITSNIDFSNVAGMESVKEELEEIIDFLSNPEKYKKLDIRLPKGLLLVGPPGVGKTFIAKALAGEANVPFFYQSGANVVEIYVGMGSKKISQLFQSAKKRSPSIIFIDEIDALGRNRGSFGNEEREATLNQLLTEMDGFDNNSGVIVIGATNRLDVLDGALLRPGRFDRRVLISLPDIKEREEILTLYLKKKPNSVDIKKLALSTVGFSVAALATLVNEAALSALKRGSSRVEDYDFEQVKDKVISGKKRIISFSEEERKIQAVYQSGKVLVATWLGVGYDKIGIVTTMFQEVDREIISKNDMLNRIKVYLAGSVATSEVFEEKYSNASEDLSQAVKRAKHLVEDYRMSESVVPSHDEVETLVLKCYEDVRVIITKLSRARERIEEYLLEYENIEEKRAKEILNDLF